MKTFCYQDFTVKTRLTDPAIMEDKLHHAEARKVGVDKQVDTYFKVKEGKLKWRKGTIENLITHYKREQQGEGEVTIVYRYDRDPTAGQIQALYDEFAVIGKIEKERTIYQLAHLKIHIDRLPDGSAWMEIEVIDKTGTLSIRQLRADCLGLQKKLGIATTDLVKTGYFNS